jgi:hypothetical protein
MDRGLLYSLCDSCFDPPMTEECMQLIFNKAGLSLSYCEIMPGAMMPIESSFYAVADTEATGRDSAEKSS